MSHPNLVDTQLKNLHAQQVKSASELQILEQRYHNLKSRYAALAPKVELQQAAHLIENIKLCLAELMTIPTARLPYDFSWIRDRLRIVSNAINHRHPEFAIDGLERASARMEEARRVYEEIEAAVEAIEGVYKDPRIESIRNTLLTRFAALTADYERVKVQWDSIKLPIHLYKTDINAAAKQICVVAFRRMDRAKSVIEWRIDALVGSLQNPDTANASLDTIEVSLAEANHQARAIETYLRCLQKAVEEHIKADARIRELNAEVERNKSVDSAFDWLYDIEAPQAPVTARSALQRRLQMAPSQFNYAYSAPANFNPYTDQRPGNTQAKRAMSKNGDNYASSAGTLPPFRGIRTHSAPTPGTEIRGMSRASSDRSALLRQPYPVSLRARDALEQLAQENSKTFGEWVPQLRKDSGRG